MTFIHVGSPIEFPELVCETLSTGRTYVTPDGNKYPSVTTVLSSLPNDAIEEWIKRVGKEEADRVRRVAGARGTAVHDIAEKYLNNEDWKTGQMPFNIMSFSYIKPILDKHVNNIVAQEVPLYSDRLETAGRVDCIAEFDGELAVIDFKTSRNKRTNEMNKSYYMQAAFYAAAYYEMTGIPIKKYAIVITVDSDHAQCFTGETFPWLKEFSKVRKNYA